MKQKIIKANAIIALSFITIIFSVNAEKKTFVGTVEPLITSKIQYGTNDVYRGFITYAARQGQILHGPTYDLNGKVIKHGDILVSIAKDYNESLLEQAKAQVQIAKANLAFYKIEYERYKNLDQTNAVSKELYQTQVNSYYQALSQLNQDQEIVKTRKIELDLCDYRVEYDCIVNKTLMPFGLCAGELPVEEISQLDPMGVNITIDRATARRIKPSTPVSIYPMASDKPVGILPHLSILTDDGIIFRVRNSAEMPNNTVDGKVVPLVKCSIALDLYTDAYTKNNIIGVPKEAILKDDKGYYVWKAIGQKSNQANKGVDLIFSVKKEYIELGEIARYVCNYKYYYSIKSKDNSVQINDLVVINPPKDLKDNDKVCYYNEIYKFMPGDKVKVEIGL